MLHTVCPITSSVHLLCSLFVPHLAQAGRPKTITGFQTHNTPVLMAAGERAELGTEKYLPLSPILEGIVLLKKNPDYQEE